MEIPVSTQWDRANRQVPRVHHTFRFHYDCHAFRQLPGPQRKIMNKLLCSYCTEMAAISLFYTVSSLIRQVRLIYLMLKSKVFGLKHVQSTVGTLLFFTILWQHVIRDGFKHQDAEKSLYPRTSANESHPDVVK